MTPYRSALFMGGGAADVLDSFETYSASGLPVGWTDPSNSGAVDQESLRPYNGTSSVRMDNDAGDVYGSSKLQRSFPGTSGLRYMSIVATSVSMKDVGSAFITVNGGSFLATARTDTGVPGSYSATVNWLLYQFDLANPNGGTGSASVVAADIKTILIDALSFGTRRPGSQWVDLFQIKRAGA